MNRRPDFSYSKQNRGRKHTGKYLNFVLTSSKERHFLGGGALLYFGKTSDVDLHLLLVTLLRIMSQRLMGRLSIIMDPNISYKSHILGQMMIHFFH